MKYCIIIFNSLDHGRNNFVILLVIVRFWQLSVVEPRHKLLSTTSREIRRRCSRNSCRCDGCYGNNCHRAGLSHEFYRSDGLQRLQNLSYEGKLPATGRDKSAPLFEPHCVLHFAPTPACEAQRPGMSGDHNPQSRCSPCRAPWRFGGVSASRLGNVGVLLSGVLSGLV